MTGLHRYGSFGTGYVNAAMTTQLRMPQPDPGPTAPMPPDPAPGEPTIPENEPIDPTFDPVPAQDPVYPGPGA